MIAKLTGLIDSLGEGYAVLDVSGVGYLVFCSGRTLARLQTGEAASLMVETQVRQDHIHLYGFWDAAERDWFRLLTSVQGVGAKVALAILSVTGADELVQAIAAGDKGMITRAPGVGPKLAGRIISELKDKVDGLALATGLGAGLGKNARAAAQGSRMDAISALINLGYNASQATGAVSHAAVNLGSDAPVEALIKAGLAELGPREHGR
ncbi:MAG: Holliday junction branch migration protein RuvA [Rhodospirillales bacterium]|nr:Holliday junction branch migration protein RuvA [Rhodospirillales bacterium]